MSAVIAAGAASWRPAAVNHSRPFYFANAATSPVAEGKPARLDDQIPVRVVGAPFVPNTNPRER